MDHAAPLLHPLPPRVPGNEQPGPGDDLVVAEDERDVEGAELPVELARRAERIGLPPAVVVHGNFRIPLREVPAPPAMSLPPRHRRCARLPGERDDRAVPWR